MLTVDNLELNNLKPQNAIRMQIRDSRTNQSAKWYQRDVRKQTERENQAAMYTCMHMCTY